MAKNKARLEGQDISPAQTPMTPGSLTPDSMVPNNLPPSGPSTGSWHLLLPGNPDSLPHIREMVDEAAARCGFSSEEIAKIEMAVDEACTNIIEHAYDGLETHNGQNLEIEVRAQGFQDRLEITIVDRSLENFPIDEQSGMDVGNYLAEERKRGLGLFIIRSFVDDVQHRFIEGHGNELLLIKYFA